MKKTKKQAKPLSAIPDGRMIGVGAAALLPVLAIHWYLFRLEQGPSYSTLLSIATYLGAFFLLLYLPRDGDKRLRRIALAGAAPLALMLVVGNSIYRTNTLAPVLGSPKDFFCSLLMLAGFLLLFWAALLRLLLGTVSWSLEPPAKNHWRFFGSSKSSLFAYWGGIFACWLPYYLAYFPGCLSYDAHNQINQILGISQLNNSHPVFHTAWLGLFVRLGVWWENPAAGLIVFSLLQMLLVSFAYAWVVRRLAVWNVHWAARALALLWFALYPSNAMFSFIPTKDALFCAAFLLAMLEIAGWARDSAGFFSSLPSQCLLGLYLLLACLLRNNTIYAVFLVLPFAVLLCRRYAKRIAAVFGVFFLLYFTITGPVYTRFGAEPGNRREMLSVPIQQLALVAVNHADRLDSGELALIETLIPYENYNPRFADPVKQQFNNWEFGNNKRGYARLWLSLLGRYPRDYFDAFLSLNVGYWFPDAQLKDEYSQRLYVETRIIQIPEYPVERASKLPGLLPYLESYARGEAGIQRLPLLSLLFSLGMPVWLLFVCGLISFARKNYSLLLLYLPGLFLWLTYMAGPVSNLRYIHAIILAYPLYLALPVTGAARGKKRAAAKAPVK